MANKTATIVVRTCQDGKRRWIPATGKNDPQGSYYIRYCQGSTPRYQRAGATYEEALAAALRMVRRLKAAAIGAVIVEEEVASKSHRIREVITAYLDELRENRRPEKSIKSKESELKRFATWSTLTYVEEITRATLIAYRNFLYEEEHLASVSVLNNLMAVSTWLKKNPIISIMRLLKTEDWKHEYCDKPDTEPNPYSEKELTAMMSAATPGERLLLRFFLGTGMREQEVAHAEFSDIKDGCIHVQAKPQYGWKPKTKAGDRWIPLGDGLLADLHHHCSTGLLFPNPTTRRPEQHYLRIIQSVARRAGVHGAGCHRFRDTFATEQVRAHEHDLRDLARIMGHENMEMLKLYAAFVDLQSERARRAANISDRFAARPFVVRSA